jgi:hypothetical protein
MAMTRRDRIVLVTLAALCLLPACSRASTEDEGTANADIATVEAIDGSDVSRVILAQEAADRLGIETAPVQAGEGGELAIPYAAVLYDPTGRTWAYTNPEPLTYVRQEIEIDTIREGMAFATTGPPVGTAVVTVGASELLGTEYEVADE